MKKTLQFLGLALVMGFGAIAQPMFFNTNAAGGGNVFPFGNTATSRKVQWFIPPNSITGVTPGNMITKVWFQAGSAATTTYPILNVKLKTGSGTGLTGVAAGPIEPGMITVYSGVGVVVTGVTGAWFGFTLTTPWLYNPNLPLIVEVEHNATTASQQIYQAVSIPGPGNGRQWADYNVGTLTGIGTQQVNFGVDVIPATPCTGVPPSNSVVPVSFTTCPNLANPSLSLATTYSLGGLTYQWQSSTLSPVGPFTSIPGATLSMAPTPTLGVTTWFQSVVTCTNPGGGTTTVTAGQFIVGGPTSSTVPYYENFELVQIPNQLPNCSWTASGLGNQNQTSVTSGSGNRVPLSGSKFASFNNTTPGTSYYYTNPIQMNAGIQYSAALWYATEYFGYSNWTNLSILVGPNQNPTGMVQVASVGPAISGPYKLLGNTFSVPTSGQYYVAIRATSSAGSAQYLSWDDLSVTIPCDPASPNSPTLGLNVSATTVCAGDPVNLTANGADSYLWNTGASLSTITEFPTTNTVYTVAGTNSLTGCVSMQSQNVVVNPSPNVFIVTDKTQVCPGQTAYLTAYGADAYAWSNASNGNMASVSPTQTSVYSVIGTNLLGCATTSSISIIVKPLPSILALNTNNAETCAGEIISLTATGGVTYKWYMSTSAILLQGSTVNVPLTTSTTFTVVGEGANGCSNKATVSQNVVPCTGIEEMQQQASGLNLFPNPSSGLLNVEATSGQLVSVELTDISGRVVLTSAVTGNKVQLDISALAKGVYYAKVTTNISTETVRVVKN